ncbi:SseB family protein [Microbacterium sp. ZXX196]|uniref:SseB family protein n=1 Tax=Microbacterium sp. ZXX196 TaxID=2609291 RepID=UPI0012B8CB0A|nr:SseB family protein [Microbacterium sp. ZXX196]MTE23168.1 SseB family protein [Microbacterium sp. ZXX196]
MSRPSDADRPALPEHLAALAGGGDSAGQPWEGRAFSPNPAAGDDGSADPTLHAALTGFRDGTAREEDVVDALRAARVLVPLVAEKGEEGVAPSGLAVDKTQELSIVTVRAPDGRAVLPAFTSVDTLRAWNPEARPIPVAGTRAALAAAGDDTDLLVLDPTTPTEFVVRRPAIWAIAQEQPWAPPWRTPELVVAFEAAIASELAVHGVRVSPGDPEARLRGPETLVTLSLARGLDRAELDAVLTRLAGRWAADDRIAVLVDSMKVALEASRD